MLYCNFFKIGESHSLLLLSLLLSFFLSFISLHSVTSFITTLDHYLQNNNQLLKPHHHPLTSIITLPFAHLKHTRPPISHPSPKQTIPPSKIHQLANNMSQNFNTIDLQPQTPKPMDAHLTDGSRKDIISEQPVCV